MKIINLNSNPTCPYVYVGRKMIGKQPREQSPLGNPFKLKGRKPDDVRRVLAEYRGWLWEKIKANDRQVMALLNSLTDESVLACYCVDLEGEAIFTEAERCHAQMVAKAWRHLQASKGAA